MSFNIGQIRRAYDELTNYTNDIVVKTQYIPESNGFYKVADKNELNNQTVYYLTINLTSGGQVALAGFSADETNVIKDTKVIYTANKTGPVDLIFLPDEMFSNVIVKGYYGTPVLKSITNLITSKYPKGVRKVAIQAPPGMLFTLDGEQMRVNKSGIYEMLDENISVSYVGVVPTQRTKTYYGEDNADFFLIDFIYEE